jgi:uncharacterized oligopeptide transporter (OPT) family protein
MQDNPVNEPAPEQQKHSAADAHEPEPLPLDLVSPQLTIRAVLTGMVLAAVLSMCNIYTGLKIGWSFNMSITAALLSYGFWMTLHNLAPKKFRHWGILENNINQTACSSGASVSSAGLVAPIPALAMLTGQTLDWHYLALWVFSVCMVGITVAIALRRQMLLVDKLPFAYGIASAETLREMYARGAEAMRRVWMLVTSGVISSAVLLLEHFKVSSKVAVDATLRGLGLDKWAQLGGFGLGKWTFQIEPTLMMYAVGGLIGFRACVSLIIGAVLAYGFIAPPMLKKGFIRLTVREPLPLAPDCKFDPEPRCYLSYDEGRHALRYSGVMTREEYDTLRAMSDDAMYREALYKLFLRSQRGAITATDFTTTRLLSISEPIGAVPSRFIIPRAYTAIVKIEAGDSPRMVLSGPMSDACHDALLKKVDAIPAEQWDSDEARRKMTAAINALYARRDSSYFPADLDLPEALAGKIEYDNDLKAIRFAGVWNDKAEHGALVQAAAALEAGDEPFAAAVKSAISGASLKAAEPNFRDLMKWLLWPGVTLMVVSSIVSFLFSWKSIAATFAAMGKKKEGDEAQPYTGDVPRMAFVSALIVALILSVTLQISFFKIVWWAAVVGVFLSFVLALVAARVTGETSITPVGAMGKVTQLVFGVLVPGQPAPNLMAANVTGGSASQCGDLLHDMKCGYLIGAKPWMQSVAQVFGAMAGALAGSAVYLLLIPNPNEQLMTDKWPAVAVAAWKAVAELFMVGFDALPKGCLTAVWIAAIAGVLLPMIEKLVPKKVRPYTLSAASLGLAMVIPAYNTISMFIGGLAALILSKFFDKWSTRFLVAVCAGIIAGESLTGVGISLERVITGLLGN